MSVELKAELEKLFKQILDFVMRIISKEVPEFEEIVNG